MMAPAANGDAGEGDGGDWPCPIAPPDRPGEGAHAIESSRAVRAKAAGEALSDVQRVHEDPSGAFVVVNKPAGVYVEDLLAAMQTWRRRGEEQRRAAPHPHGDGDGVDDGGDAATTVDAADVGAARLADDDDDHRGERQQQRQQRRELGQQRRQRRDNKRSKLEEDAASAGGRGYLNLLHRLDRDTSGCLVFALTPEANKSLARAFQEGLVSKEYLAHCAPPPTTPRATAKTPTASAGATMDSAPRSSTPSSAVRAALSAEPGSEEEVRTGHGMEGRDGVLTPQAVIFLSKPSSVFFFNRFHVRKYK